MWTKVPIGCVRLGDEYLKNAFAKEVNYLLALETGRLLSGFYSNAGLKTPYVRYGGWENSLIGGHTLGHYLSALSRAACAAEGEVRANLLARMGAALAGLEAAQNAVGTGLIWGALPVAGGIEAQFDHVEAGETDLRSEAWVPWYTLHKLLAGLLDCAACTAAGELRPRALEVAKKLGDWVVRRVQTWDEATRRTVLSVEYGGMNDALYALYAATGKESYADAAHAFDEIPLFEGVLARRKDFLNGKHANTTIPKFLGALRRYFVLHGKRFRGETVDASRYLLAARAFFETVVGSHTYVTGGNSEWEHFGRDGVLDAERTNCNAETCNVYNMRKLACGLFCATGERAYLDYDENAFTNAILSSQDPETGMTTYFQPMASGFFKVFSRPFDCFWCCTGSGMENFSGLGDGIYYTDGARLLVARWTASSVTFAGATVRLSCNFPLDDRARLTVAGNAELLLRVPDWCAGEPEILQNGIKVPVAGAFCAISARDGDAIDVHFPVTVTLAGLPDSRDVFAFKYGGAVLSADFGSEAMEETTTGVDVSIPKRKLGSEAVWFERVGDVLRDPARFLVRQGEKFVLRGADRPIEFGLHYRRSRGRYAIYLRFAEYAWENGVRVKREERGAREQLDTVQPGYGQYEMDALHAMREKDSVGVTSDGTYRYARAGGFFGYDLRVDPAQKNSLRLTLRREDNGKPLRVLLGGEEVFFERLCYTMGEEEYAREIALPPELVRRAVRQKTVNGETVQVVDVCFTGGDGESARLFEPLAVYSESASISEK